ncbi:MAG TPA: DUF4232 domain-containing protein [Gaiellaceae bacterium]|jgi:hypothetical protein
MRVMTIGITALCAVVACAVSAPLSALGAASHPCKGSQLDGAFKGIPGSAGAGNIVYRLRIVNTSTRACFVTGIPVLTLLDKNGRKLPTKGAFSGPRGALTAIVVPLAVGGHASLTARFSPDIPGPGESTSGPCEKTAYKLRVAVSGGGATTVPIVPPTPVCEHGSLQLSVFTQT